MPAKKPSQKKKALHPFAIASRRRNAQLKREGWKRKRILHHLLTKKMKKSKKTKRISAWVKPKPKNYRKSVFTLPMLQKLIKDVKDGKKKAVSIKQEILTKEQAQQLKAAGWFKAGNIWFSPDHPKKATQHAWSEN